MKYLDIGKTEFKIHVNQVDTEGRLNLRSLAGLLQESSVYHADNAGFGYDDMKDAGLLWVLTRMKIKVHKLPKWRDKVFVETWIINREKFFTRRDFEMRSEQGELLVSAISGWMLVDIIHKRPHLADAFPMDIKMFPNKLAINQQLDKLQEIKNVKYSHDYHVKYSDLDIVNHMNNSHYKRIILDTYPLDFRKKYIIDTFEINYLAEALYDNELRIDTEELSDNQEYKHEIVREKDNRILCRVVVSWQESK